MRNFKTSGFSNLCLLICISRCMWFLSLFISFQRNNAAQGKRNDVDDGKEGGGEVRSKRWRIRWCGELLRCDSRVSFQRDTMWHFNALFQPAKSLICKTSHGFSFLGSSSASPSASSYLLALLLSLQIPLTSPSFANRSLLRVVVTFRIRVVGQEILTIYLRSQHLNKLKSKFIF